jgi:REP element-mobilizing transposase RayT
MPPCCPCMEAQRPSLVHRVIPTNLGLLKLIRANQERNWRPSLAELQAGFRGWHQRGFLPHFDAPHVTQVITFSLMDAFPVSRRAEWEPFLRAPEDSARRKKLEAWLDRGLGECWLRQQQVAEVVEQVLLDGNGIDFQLQAWVIMPNHVHLVVDVRDVPMVRLVGNWKGKSARVSNLALGRRGCFWQEDYFDTMIRDRDHLATAIRYTEQNPAKATFVKDPREWCWSSDHRRDEFGRLPWQYPHTERK